MLYQWSEKLSLLLARSEALFIVDDIIVDESLDKWSQSLLNWQAGIVTIMYGCLQCLIQLYKEL